MKSTDEWAEEMPLRTAKAFVEAHGIAVRKTELQNGNNGWPQGYKRKYEDGRRWRRDELLAAIAKRKGA